MKLLLASILLPGGLSQDQRYTPSNPASILAEQYLDNLSYQSSLLSIASDVPVTLQKYSDTSQSFLMGAEPVPQNLGMVLVTSDCSSEDTSVVPEITVDGDSITVNLGVDGKDMGFLQETTSYETFWSYVYGMCGLNYFGSTELNVALIEGTDASVTGTDAPAGSAPSPTPTVNATFITEATQAATSEATTTFGANAGYEECGFTCCTNEDCGEDCCIEGVCQGKENDFDLCAEPPIKPTNDGECGPVAYKNFQEDGNCPNGSLPLGGATIPGEQVVTSTFTTTTTDKVTEAVSSTVNSFDRTTTSPEPEVLNPCGQGKCLNPDGECAMTVMCLNDPCNAEDNGCDGAECVANYCGGCNAVCGGITTSQVDSTEVATTPATDTETLSTNIPLTEPSSTTSAADENPCVKGKCLNFAGVCAREVICMTHPCDALDCNPDQECIANFCGGCNAFCFGGATESPTDVPSQGPSQELITPPVIAPGAGPEPVPVVEEAEPSPSSPTVSQPIGNRPIFDQYQNPEPSAQTEPQTAPNQPTSNGPDEPVVVVINVPVQTVPIPSPVEGKTEDGTDKTDTVDILDTLNPTTTPSPSSISTDTSRPSSSLSHSHTKNESTSPAPTYETADRFVDAVLEEADSSGFTTTYSLQARMALTLIVILVVTMFTPQDGTSHNLFGVGKIIVAAAFVSSLFTRSANNKVRHNAPPRHFVARKLQGECTYNVELLYDGCTKSVTVDAPSARVIDVVMEDYNSETNENDECQTDYSANLTFPTSNSTDVDLSSNGTVPAYRYSDWQCLRAIEGRPFVDANGKGIQAVSMLTESCAEEMKVEWSGKVMLDTSVDNATNHNQVMLGNDWTRRALGEHASIASFSAFSIALMTNAAPSMLVEDALLAGIDEIRHARTSFDIASKLLGKNVEPSSLPESTHAFGQDLVALALALAREGCVDETLSAFAAAVEVDSIERMLVGGTVSSKYSGVDSNMLRWIAGELKTIALDESNHSALAWRTLKWICGVDSSVCGIIQKEVFDETKLRMRFHQRAEGNEALAARMKTEWERIYMAFKSSNLNDESNCDSNDSLVTSVTEKVLGAMS